MADVLPKLGDWMFSSDDAAAKLLRSFPWLMRYWAGQLGSRLFGESGSNGPDHLIFMVANHFEPAWNEAGMPMDLAFQRPRVERWCKDARSVGAAFKDSDGMPFRHTYFYPAEQYHSCLLEELAALQMEGFGDVEIHLHHGVDRPDHPINLRETLVRFRDLLAGEHGCLSRMDGNGPPMYAFVHGNYALANSARGRYCGVDSELQILAETGCYSDFTLPTAPHCTQVPRINSIYQCGEPFDRRCAHKRGDPVRVGAVPKLPIVFTGPLVLDWSRRVRGVPYPRIDIGAIADNYQLSFDRLNRWRQKARVCVKGRPEWIFIKLFCHGFFPWDRQMLLGEPLRRFLDQLLDHSAGSGEFKVHFATAREAFNMVMAGVDGHAGEPGLYRNYRLKPVSNGLGETSGASVSSLMTVQIEVAMEARPRQSLYPEEWNRHEAGSSPAEVFRLDRRLAAQTAHSYEIEHGQRFEFGLNWSRFLKSLSVERIKRAEESLKQMLGVEDLQDNRFLDVGSGSGLFSLAARRLGATVHSFDYDSKSVACTAELKRRFFAGDGDWCVETGSALDAGYLKSLGTFDVVYSWGVLHHTGNLWGALDNVQLAVAPGGKLFIAVYNDMGSQSARWRWIKQTYNRLPKGLRLPFTLAVIMPAEAKAAARSLLLLRPAEYLALWRTYGGKRGMSRWRDIVDWVGGYPYEVATPDQVFDFYQARGFVLIKMHCGGVGLGCNEFVFARQDMTHPIPRPVPALQ